MGSRVVLHPWVRDFLHFSRKLFHNHSKHNFFKFCCQFNKINSCHRYLEFNIHCELFNGKSIRYVPINSVKLQLPSSQEWEFSMVMVLTDGHVLTRSFTVLQHLFWYKQHFIDVYTNVILQVLRYLLEHIIHWLEGGSAAASRIPFGFLWPLQSCLLSIVYLDN